jgi:antitoxin HigA-1
VLNDTSEPSAYDPVRKDFYQRETAPPHPGEILRDDILPVLGLSKTALAKRLRITPRRLGNLLAERTPITADLALRLGTVLGHGARYWLGLQMQHDLWAAAQPPDVKLTPVIWKRPSRPSGASLRTAAYR